MADIRQVRTRLASAHTSIETAASILDLLEPADDFRYIQRECHKILGRLEALEAGLAHMQPARPRRRSINEAGGNDAGV